MIQKQQYANNMPTNILIDLNIILDVFLERQGHKASSEVIQTGEQHKSTLHISGHMVTTFGYLLEHARVPRQLILQHIEWLLNTFTVVPTDKILLEKALKSTVADYEDAVVVQAAVISQCEMIITRNLKDFKASTIKALDPEQFLKAQ